MPCFERPRCAPVRLASFSLQKYRSIRRAEKFTLGDMTVLIGPNNEGKTNILNGLVAGMHILRNLPDTAGGTRATVSRLRAARYFYSWDRDFPVDLQASKPDGVSIFDYVFELTSAEVDEFKSEVKSNLNGTLPIRLSIGEQSVKFEVRKKGPGGTALSKKSTPIARFVARRINVRDIPAVRTADSSLRMVDEMVQRALQGIESSEEYAQAVQKIADLQRPILDEIGTELRDMVQLFLPEVSDIRIDVADRLGALRRSNKILVDDGTVTELSHKGDGVQSLAALALIHRVAMDQARGRELILAVEEPEAHLHPRAIHKLKGVLGDIAASQQVIITTHSPLFANRSDISSNVIVDKSRARPARTIAEIRDTLGVRVSDSLSSAEVVLICEGECDRVALAGLLPSRSPALADAVASGRLAIDGMQGSGNLKYKLALYRDHLCSTHSLVDHDAAGIAAVDQAALEGLCQPSDVTYTVCPGRKESGI